MKTSWTTGRIVAIGIAAVALIGSILLFSGALFRTYRNPTSSMEPTLPKDVTLIATPATTARRGDVIAFHYPLDRNAAFAKRVVAVGSDVVELRDKQLFVNGVEVNEPYVVHEDGAVYPRLSTLPEPYRSRDNFGPVRVPFGGYFVLGDNRDQSSDSRYWGCIDPRDLIGHVRWFVSPQTGFRSVR